MMKRSSCFFKAKPIILLGKWNRLRKIAKILNLSKEAHLRLEWIIFYYKVGKDASKTASHFGISRKTFHKWHSRFNELDLKSLESYSKAPKQTRQREISFKQEQRIIKLRKDNISWGKMKLKVLYAKEYGEEVSSWKIQKVIEKYELYPNPIKAEKIRTKKKKAKKKPWIGLLLKEPLLGHLIHFDTIVIYWNSLKRYIFTAIDEETKIAYARMYATKSSYSARDFLYRLDFLLDYKLTNSHTDKGSEFKAYFEKALEELGIIQYESRTKTPKDNPSLERFNRTLQEEWLNHGNFTPDIKLFNKELTDWLIKYNFIRPHQTLNYLTPMEYALKRGYVLPMYPSRTQS